MDEKMLTVSTLSPKFESALRVFSAAYLTPDTYLPVGGRSLARTSKPEPTDDGEYNEEADYTVETLKEAEVITSMLGDDMFYHMPVLDIDVPCEYVPSSTPGHGHLYFHHKMSWSQYLKLMKVMVECGLLEEGYVNASEARGYTAVRLPWVKKGNIFFDGWVKILGTSDESAFELPEWVKEYYDPDHDLLVVQHFGTDSYSETWCIVHGYYDLTKEEQALKASSTKKMALEGKFFMPGEQPKFQTLMGAKGEALLGAGKEWDADKTGYAYGYREVKPAMKPKNPVVKSALAEDWDESNKVFPVKESESVATPLAKFEKNVKKALKGKSIDAGAIIYDEIDLVKATSVKTPASGGTHDVGMKVEHTWSNTYLETAVKSKKHAKGTETILYQNGPLSAHIPTVITNAHPIKAVYAKPQYTNAEKIGHIVIEFSDATDPVLMSDFKETAGYIEYAVCELAWAATLEMAKEGLAKIDKHAKFFPLYAAVDSPDPAPQPETDAPVKISKKDEKTFSALDKEGKTYHIPAKILGFDGSKNDLAFYEFAHGTVDATWKFFIQRKENWTATGIGVWRVTAVSPTYSVAYRWEFHDDGNESVTDTYPAGFKPTGSKVKIYGWMEVDPILFKKLDEDDFYADIDLVVEAKAPEKKPEPKWVKMKGDNGVSVMVNEDWLSPYCKVFFRINIWGDIVVYVFTKGWASGATYTFEAGALSNAQDAFPATHIEDGTSEVKAIKTTSYCNETFKAGKQTVSWTRVKKS